VAAAGCSTLLAGGQAQLERTWRAARVWIPGRALQPPRAAPLTGRLAALDAPLDRLGAATSIPLVIYVHDCAGLDREAELWGERLAAQGYATIAPDSLARGGRAPTCPSRDLDAVLTRESEIRYALAQARATRWVRQRAVFVLGVGQGGTIVARGGVGKVTGAVIIRGSGDARRVSPALVREGLPGEDDLAAVVDFLQRLTPR